jgi:hypothetical protein
VFLEQIKNACFVIGYGFGRQIVSVTLARSTVARLQKDVSGLRTKDAAEARKEADMMSKFHRAVDGANRTSSATTRSSKLREADRAQGDLNKIAKARADLSKNLAAKGAELTRAQERLSREEAQEQKKALALDKKLQGERDRQIKALDSRLRDQVTMIANAASAAPSALGVDDGEVFDAFISHASEDKEDFVRDFAVQLRDAGVTVWYDEFSLKWGDSLRRNIDRGLARSRFGIVVLSTRFFEKQWPQKELDGLVALENAGRSRILPIWHKISKDEVTRFSPTLADKVALNTSVDTVADIVARLVEFRDAANAA